VFAAFNGLKPSFWPQNVLKTPENTGRMSVSDGNIASFGERRTEKRGRFSALARRVLAGAEFLEQKSKVFVYIFRRIPNFFPI
jgi:hypothetical protein